MLCDACINGTNVLIREIKHDSTSVKTFHLFIIDGLIGTEISNEALTNLEEVKYISILENIDH